MNIADSFSRLCKIEESETFDKEAELNILRVVEEVVPKALTVSDIVQKAEQDPDLMKAIELTQSGRWLMETSSPYFAFNLELSTLGKILMRGTRIIIPEPLRNRVLELTHEGHPGETAMKRRVRAKVWWPRVDRDVEKFVKKCKDCLIVSQPDKPPPMTRHKFPKAPWLCLAVDLLGPLPNQVQILVLIDYYSRYTEVKYLKSITSSTIVDCLEEVFSRLGYPESITADNDRQFVSTEFKTFCNVNNIRLITSPPYWLQANGEVENMNRSLVKRRSSY